jgi:septum formation protein
MAGERLIVLGSSSVWRKKVLADAGVRFVAMAPDIDEKAIRSTNAAVLTAMIAAAKADAIVPYLSKYVLLITADQVAVFRGEIREKPRGAIEARRWLGEYGEGDPVSTVTAVAVTDLRTMQRRSLVDTAVIRFDRVPPEAIDAVLARGTVLGSCGAFAIDDPALAPFVGDVCGDGGEAEVRSSIDGLPLQKTLSLLKSFGWKP